MKSYKMKRLLCLFGFVVSIITGISCLVIFQQAENALAKQVFVNELFFLIPVGYFLIAVGLLFGLVYRVQSKRQALENNSN